MSLLGFKNPIIAILRGIKPEEAIDICEALVSEGVEIIEVPLNSPDPFVSIKKLVDHFGNKILLGAGTVLQPAQVTALADTGAKLMVTPNFDPEVVEAALQHKLIAAPGVYTPSEAFAAYKAGVKCIKLFPGGRLGLPYLKDIQAVLPPDLDVVIVGGVDAANVGAWISGGAAGVGAGSSIYMPGDTPEIAANKAKALVKGLQQ
ncbi:2-dehydro-3-deoxy-6-phosphogalactonate aldolase [Robiginitomaculum antarcticum]|uniref:2-dehydro-3-deoxy-6-phosphogalactonate aldolase n=1 Tax=Robiginitomaculum antarcticum TaxID=437507 RepID=UPI00035F49A4|nr:2-dehydro-3-deoxy-6-phosphogalactonate aldolase [Robiginitomaculum antarcticum]